MTPGRILKYLFPQRQSLFCATPDTGSVRFCDCWLLFFLCLASSKILTEMSEWDGWAAYFIGVDPRVVGEKRVATGVTIYDPKDGAVWGKSGTIPLDGCVNLKTLDDKAIGKEVSIQMGKKPVFFIKKTQDDSPVTVFKIGNDKCIVTHEGPASSRVAVYIEDGNPKPYIAALPKAKEGKY